MTTLFSIGSGIRIGHYPERKSTSEFLFNHDCCHILGGFNTDVQDEMNVAAFQAKLFDDGFSFKSLLEVILDFHMGKAFSTVGNIIPPSTRAFTQTMRRKDMKRAWLTT